VTWPGGKDGAGVAQRLINQIPPHDVFVSPFLGDCAVLRRIQPAGLSHGCDLDPAALERFAAGVADSRGGVLRLFQSDGIAFLRFLFCLDQLPPSAALSGDRTRWFLFVDPPYPRDSRKNGKRLYAHEMTDDDHARLLATLKAIADLPACVNIMLCSYPNPLYDRELIGWRTWDHQVQTRQGVAMERVYYNYPQPTKLHDYRFVGQNKRERERIRRRCSNWVDGLGRMGDQERGAVLQAIREAYGC